MTDENTLKIWKRNSQIYRKRHSDRVKKSQRKYKLENKEKMPRPSDAREFGFRAEGILRILVAADPEQVLIAVEELGFRLPDRKPIETLTDLVQTASKESEELISDFIGEFTKAIEFAIFELEEDPAPGEARAARALKQLRERQKAFVLDLQRKRVQLENQLSEIVLNLNLPTVTI